MLTLNQFSAITSLCIAASRPAPWDRIWSVPVLSHFLTPPRPHMGCSESFSLRDPLGPPWSRRYPEPRGWRELSSAPDPACSAPQALGWLPWPADPYLEAAQLFPAFAKIGAFTVPLALELLVHAGRGLQNRSRGSRGPGARDTRPSVHRRSRHLPWCGKSPACFTAATPTDARPAEVGPGGGAQGRGRGYDGPQQPAAGGAPSLSGWWPRSLALNEHVS
jgi:hypothetical protein